MRIGIFLILSCRCWLITPTIGILDFQIILLRNDYTEIMKHLWKKLNSHPKEWRRIFKSLHAMEYLVKNGAPRTI